MMRLGDRRYELVRSQSGFSVTLGPARSARGPQAWQLDLHYVPAENNPQLRGLWELEHLELCCQPFHYQTADWRELSGFGPGPELDPILFNITLGNLLGGGSHHPRHSVCPDEISIKPLGGFQFRCHFEGRLTRDGQEKDLELDEEISFAQVSVSVPVNAADIEAAAQAIARREIKLTEFAGSHITRNDWRKEQNAADPIEFSHHVTLFTPWRNELA
jgi:hypothetical protein